MKDKLLAWLEAMNKDWHKGWIWGFISAIALSVIMIYIMIEPCNL